MTASKPPIPILHSADATSAKAFDLNFLGITLLFNHHFAADLSLDFAVNLEVCDLHISELRSDAVAGNAMQIELPDVAALCQTLHQRGA